jgi:hypothetical protein
MKDEVEDSHVMLNKAEDLTAWSSRCVLQNRVSEKSLLHLSEVGCRLLWKSQYLTTADM